MLSEGFAALIPDNSDDRIRVSAAILPASAIFTSSLFQNRPRRYRVAPLEFIAPAAFVFHGCYPTCMLGWLPKNFDGRPAAI